MFYLIFILNIFFASGNDGTYYLNKGLENKENYAEAEVNFKTAIELFKKDYNYKDLAQTYYYLGYLNELYSKFEPSIIYYNKSLSALNKIQDNNLLFKCNERLITIYIYLNNFNDANRYLKLNSQLINEIDNKNRYYYTEAFYYYSIRENGNALQSLRKFDLKNLDYLELDYYNILASVFDQMGDYHNALENYNNLLNKDSSNITFLLNTVKFLYKNNDYKKGDRYYKKLRGMKDSTILIERAQNNLLHSEILFLKGDYNKSLSILDSIKPFFETNQIYNKLSECLVVYKNNYRELKRYEDYDRVVEEILSVKEKQINSQLETVSKINDALFNLEKENLELSHQNDIYTLTTYSTIAIFILTIVVVIIAFIKRRKTNEYKQKIKQIDAENQALRDILDNDFHNALDSYHETIYSNLDANKDSKVFNDFDKLVKIKKQINDFLSNRNKKIF